MEGDVLVDEARDEEVRVVVALARAEAERLADLGARRAQRVGVELALGEEVVARPLVDEDLAEARKRPVRAQERARVLQEPANPDS